MRRFLSSLIITLSLLIAPMALVATAPALAADDPSSVSRSKQVACEGVGLAGTDDCGATAGAQISKIVATIVNLLSVVVGIAAVVMIIVSGFKYITSGGDSNKVSSAKSALVYAIIGLIVVALAQFIVHFVLNNIK